MHVKLMDVRFVLRYIGLDAGLVRCGAHGNQLGSHGAPGQQVGTIPVVCGAVTRLGPTT